MVRSASAARAAGARGAPTRHGVLLTATAVRRAAFASASARADGDVANSDAAASDAAGSDAAAAASGASSASNASSPSASAGAGAGAGSADVGERRTNGVADSGGGGGGEWPELTTAEIVGAGFDAFREFPSDEELASTRFKSRKATPPAVPSPQSPTGMTWTVELFLQRIARGCEAHVDKFESWEALFTARGAELKKLGIPVRERRWILRWTEHYRQGLEPLFISKARSKARKNNPGMEKRRRQKYPGWAEYMFPDMEEVRRNSCLWTRAKVLCKSRAQKKNALQKQFDFLIIYFDSFVLLIFVSSVRSHMFPSVELAGVNY